MDRLDTSGCVPTTHRLAGGGRAAGLESDMVIAVVVIAVIAAAALAVGLRRAAADTHDVEPDTGEYK